MGYNAAVKFVWLCMLSLVALVACSNLRQIQPGVCGNRVVDPGEDCDAPGAACGQPSSKHPCRFLCKTTSDCPKDYACGDDGVCREATGTFSRGPLVPAAQALSYSVADVDGDGYDDIVAETKAGWLGVDYLDASGLAATTRSRSVALPFAVGQLTAGDSRADIAHLPHTQLDVLTGQADRSILPLAYAGIQSLAPPGHSVVLFSLDAIYVTPNEKKYNIFGGQEILGLAGPYVYTAGHPQPLFRVSESSDRLAPRLLAGGIPTAKLDTRLNCDDFVLADQDADYVSVYAPCVGDGPDKWSPTGGNYPKVSLAGGAKVGEGVLLADINKGDTYPDLIIAGKAPHPGADVTLYVAYGLGNGTFNSTPPPLAPGRSPDSLAVPLGEAPGLPLAAGDLNLDGVADFVFQNVAVESDESQGPCFDKFSCWSQQVFKGAWKQAAIGDLNDNGLPDVVAIPKDSRYVQFYNGTGKNLFNESDIQTNGYPTSLTVADFDGDLVDDIAVAEADDPRSCKNSKDMVSILFGALAEPPSAPVNMGQLDCVSQFVAGNFFGVGGVDWSADLAAVEVTPDGADHVATFAGSTDRQILAPLSLIGADGTPDNEIAVQIGKFQHDQANADIAALSYTGAPPPPGGASTRKPELWMLPATGDAALSNAYASGPLQTDLDPCSAQMVRADLDGDGLDELALLGRSTSTGSVVVVAKVDPKSHKPGIVKTLDVKDVDLVQPSVSETRCTGIRGQPQMADYSESTEVQTADLYGDGKSEIVVLGLSGQKQVIKVFSWAGSGHDIKESSLALPSGIDPEAFTIMNADADPALEIVLATQHALYVSDLDLSSHTIGAPRQIATLYSSPGPTPIPGVGIGGVIGLESGDFNGDGVRDLALGRQSGFQIFYGVPGIQ